MNSFQRKTLASYGVASETDSLCQLFPSVLFPEAGTTEEKAHVTCAPQQAENRRFVAVPAFNSPYMEGIILHLSDSKAPQSKLVVNVLLVVCH